MERKQQYQRLDSAFQGLLRKKSSEKPWNTQTEQEKEIWREGMRRRQKVELERQAIVARETYKGSAEEKEDQWHMKHHKVLEGGYTVSDNDATRDWCELKYGK
jgi:hypothetical protein